MLARRGICPDFAGLVDAVSISLNAPDAEEYLRLNRSQFGAESYEGMLRFAEDVRKYVPDVTLATAQTTLTSEQELRCQAICDELGVAGRIRPWQD